MIVLLSCPWCEADMSVEDGDLGGELRCDECATAFSFAPERRTASEVAEAA